MTASVYSDRRKILFEIRNTLLRRRDVVRRALFNHTDIDNEEKLRCESKRIDAVLDQMRRGVFGIDKSTGTLIPAEQLLADPFLVVVD